MNKLRNGIRVDCEKYGIPIMISLRQLDPEWQKKRFEVKWQKKSNNKHQISDGIKKVMLNKIMEISKLMYDRSKQWCTEWENELELFNELDFNKEEIINSRNELELFNELDFNYKHRSILVPSLKFVSYKKILKHIKSLDNNSNHYLAKRIKYEMNNIDLKTINCISLDTIEKKISAELLNEISAVTQPFHIFADGISTSFEIIEFKEGN